MIASIPTGDVCFPIVRQLAEYEVWCLDHTFSAAATLSPDQLVHPFPFGLHTIHRTLFHTLEVFRYWGLFVGTEMNDDWRWDYDPAATIAYMQAASAELSARFLANIDASHTAGLLHQDRRLVQVLHLVTHGTHHRTQFITMLRLLGINPPFEAGDFAGWQNTESKATSKA